MKPAKAKPSLERVQEKELPLFLCERATEQCRLSGKKALTMQAVA
ncbi:MAG TPA: hypothetical protein VL418_15550 [Devosiaceae bacterium]|jgi:hypothetical protein|nr:hypothetical protein [Devosiaceae bacterium]